MSQDGHWADNPIIRATADALNIKLNLLRPYVIDNVLTWLFLIVSRFQEIREFLDNIQHLKNIKQMLDSYHIF